MNGGYLNVAVTEDGYPPSRRLFLPRHVRKFLRRLDCWRGRGWFGECQIRIFRRWVAGSGFIFAPRRDARLQAVMLGRFFVARLHVEQRKIRVDELLLGFELLGLVPVCDGRGKIPFAIECHSQRKLRVEVCRLGCEDGEQLGDGVIEVAIAESEHRVVVLFLESFGHAPR